MDLKVIGETIKKYREQNSIPREVMAAELNMTPNAYGRIERGEVDLQLTRVEQIATVLKVGLAQILNLDAGQIFNISNSGPIKDNGSVQRIMNTYNHSDEFKDRYIEKLEKEVEAFRKKAAGTEKT